MAKPRGTGILPSRDELLEFIRGQRTPLGKREIAREYRLQATDRPALSEMLDALEENGDIHRARNRRYSAGRKIPSVCVLEVTGLDRDGEPVLAIAGRDAGAASPRIHLARGKQRGRAPGIGDRVLARMDRKSENYYVAHIMRRLESRPASIFGIFRKSPSGGQIEPASRKLKTHFHVDTDDVGSAEDGEFVTADVLPGRQFGMPTASITGRIGAADDPGAITQLCIAENDIPVDFSQEAQAEADDAEAAPMGARTDLRELLLITIDDATARDFDDAVWAEPDPDPDNKGGWHLIVAIADVAWYVRPGNALDRAAETRGNSVYLPNRVVPMLPEALSNEWCSLKPGEDRPCLTVDMWIDAGGHKLRHRFGRAMMRSAARMTYDRVQALHDGKRDTDSPDLPEGLLNALYGAYRALLKKRKERGAIDLDMPERRISIGENGKIEGVETRVRHDSHRLIEEFMILANVSAAETLQQTGQPCMYRVHDDPAADRVEALRRYLGTIGLSLGGGQAVRPRHFAQLVSRLKDRKDADAIQDSILRCQAQAVYSPDNLGHFGLALRDYAHFTSPIRRYSDLLVHRALIKGLRLGDGALPPKAGERFQEIGAHISMTERRAMAAERDAFDRLATLFLSDRVGAQFFARVTGVERFGLFVEIDEYGVSALLPVSLLGNERFEFDAGRLSLTGQTSKKRYTAGDRMEVRLSEADTVTGRLAVEPVNGERQGGENIRGRSRNRPGKQPVRGRRGRKHGR